MKTVYFDIDTQLDFIVPSGALYFAGAERILPAIRTLNQRAAATGAVVISSTDAHRENDEEFHHWPPHCIIGTLGQRKPQSTLLDKQVVVPWREHLIDITGAQQIVLQKRVLDVFRNPNLAGILDLLAADRYVLYGVATEICVSCAADGLLNSGKRVELVTDAIMGVNAAESEKVISSFTARGGVLTTVASLS